jgi:hypothetical protein
MHLRRLGAASLGPLLGALGLKINLVEDPDALKRIERRIVPRDEVSVRRSGVRLWTIDSGLRKQLLAEAREQLLEEQRQARAARRNGRLKVNGHGRAR